MYEKYLHQMILLQLMNDKKTADNSTNIKLRYRTVYFFKKETQVMDVWKIFASKDFIVNDETTADGTNLKLRYQLIIS